MFDLWMLIILPMGLLTTANVLPKILFPVISSGPLVSSALLCCCFAGYPTLERRIRCNRYAAELIGDKEALIRALTILNEKSGISLNLRYTDGLS